MMNLSRNSQNYKMCYAKIKIMTDIFSEKYKLAYSVEEISERTSLSKAFLRLEIKRGKLKVRRFGRRVIIRDEDLREYIANGSDGGQMELNA